MTNYEKMKRDLPPDVGIKTAAKVLSEGKGRCQFCADGKIADILICRGNCYEGVLEQLQSEVKE